jgi:hypothetical protein
MELAYVDFLRLAFVAAPTMNLARMVSSGNRMSVCVRYPAALVMLLFLVTFGAENLGNLGTDQSISAETLHESRPRLLPIPAQKF